MDTDRILTIAESVDPIVWLVLGALIVLLMVIGMAIGWALAGWKRRRAYRNRFGPEFDRVRASKGDETEAEVELDHRREQVRQFNIRPLTPQEQDSFSQRWRQTQARFVDDPADAIREATDLVEQVLGARGFPVADFDRQADALSVEHPRVVENYRSARTLSTQREHGAADTEDLRRAMVHYGQLFEDLLVVEEPAAESTVRVAEAQ